MSALTIANARAWVRDYARNASDQTEYPNARIDRAIQYIGTEFVKFTRCTRQTDTIALTNNSATVNTSALTNFRPEYLVGDPKAWVTVSSAFTASVDVVAEDVLFEKQLHCPSTSAPCSRRSIIAFLTNSTSASGATIYPTVPDDGVAYVLNLMWAPPFITWTPGNDISNFLIPDEYMIPLLTLYVPRALQHNEPEHGGYAADRDAEFMAYCRLCAGSGNLGDTSIQRESVDDIRGRRWR